MIQLLFGTWKRRIVTVLGCLATFAISLVAALAVAVGHSPASAQSALKVPGLGRMAVAVAEWRHGGPLSEKPPEVKQDVKTFRELRPLSAEEVAQLIQDLKTERQACVERTQEIERERKRVDLYRAEIGREREQLVALRDKVVSQWEEIKKSRAAMDKQVVEIQTVEAKNLKQLAASYEAMKPDRAAAIVKKLDEQTAAKTLYLMKERAAAKIIEALDPDASAKLTERMLLLKQSAE